MSISNQPQILQPCDPRLVHAHLDTTCDFPRWFLECQSYGAIVSFPDGASKWVELQKYHNTFKTFERFYQGINDNKSLLGLHFGFKTNRIVLDIDRGSKYHPLKDESTFNDLLAALEEELSLCGYFLVRSSNSGGIHAYFPLSSPISSRKAQRLVTRCLNKNGFTIADGTLEIFPNVDNDGYSKQALRLPLQQGSYLLDSLTFDPYSQNHDEFMRQVAIATAKNELALQAPGQKTQGYFWTRPSFTRYSQANSHIMPTMANIGHWMERKTTVPSLANWMRHKVPELEGYQEFASDNTKFRIELGTWCDEWAKSHFRSCHLFQQKEKIAASNYHQGKAETTQEKFKAVVSAIIRRGIETAALGVKKLEALLNSISHELFGEGFGSKSLNKYRRLWECLKTSQAAPNLIKGEVGCCLDAQGFGGRTQLPPKPKQLSPKLSLLTWSAIAVATAPTPKPQSMTPKLEFKKGDRVVVDDNTGLPYCGQECTIAAVFSLQGHTAYRLDIDLHGKRLKPRQRKNAVEAVAPFLHHFETIQPLSEVSEVWLNQRDIQRLRIPGNHWLHAICGSAKQRIRADEVDRGIWQQLLSVGGASC